MKRKHILIPIALLALYIFAAAFCLLQELTPPPTPPQLTATFGAAEFHLQLTAGAAFGHCLPYPCPTPTP